jgi:prepilin-type N-terminal cleavage/methylation domain-containing protein
MGYSKYMSNIVSSRTQTRGFTLIELLVVIAIIGILSSVVLASLNTARQKGADAAIKSNLTGARSQAELYYDDKSPNSYTGVCTNVAGSIYNAVLAAAQNAGISSVSHNTPAGGAGIAVCDDSPSAWAAQVPLKATANTFFCVDSSGQAVTVTGTKLTPAGDTSCS